MVALDDKGRYVTNLAGLARTSIKKKPRWFDGAFFISHGGTVAVAVGDYPRPPTGLYGRGAGVAADHRN
jgi:hypothetical protein